MTETDLSPELKAALEKKNAEEAANKDASSSSEGEDKETSKDVAVGPTEKELAAETLIAMHEAAHATLVDADGNELKISDLSLAHPYWGLMNKARQFQAEKGL